MEFVTGHKGGRKPLYKGFPYVVNRKQENRIYWRCEKRDSCSASIITCNNEIQKISNSHSHPPDEARNCSLKVKESIKERSLQSNEATSNVINHATSDLPLSICGALPQKESIARSVRRARVRANADEDLTVTTRGDNFLLYDSESLSIYSTTKNLDILKTRNKWLSDGTFNCAPVGKQLYTIHAVVAASKTLPLLYCLASNKDEKTYEEMFEFLKEQNLYPESVTMDFEQAAIKALRKCFPNTIVYGCLFHFGQCLWRKIQSLGLQSWYRDPENALIIKQIEALAFVPPRDATELFTDFMQSLDQETDEVLSEFLEYFEITWLGIVQRGRRRRPAFDIEMWNVFNRIESDFPRTNNSLEGWHQAFNKRVGVTHPTIEKLVKKIKLEQANTEVILEQLSLGENVTRINKKYSRINERIRKVHAIYDRSTGLTYLRSIAHNL